MLQLLISWAINFVILFIAFTIGYYIVLGKLKRKLKAQNMLPEITVEKIGGEYAATFKYGNQTFHCYSHSEIEFANYTKEMLIKFFNEYKNGVIDEM